MTSPQPIESLNEVGSGKKAETARDTQTVLVNPRAEDAKNGAATAVVDPKVIPNQFGRYRIERELGRGGMGVVFLAHDQQLDRKVALKVPFFREDDDAESVERFYREARAMATVQQANLCPVFDVGLFEQWHFLTMAFIDGEPLSTKLKHSGAMAAIPAVTLLKKVAVAVQKAHDAGIVHRDLKPSNIMLTADLEPIIMDFGLARIQKSGEADLTHSGAVLGSPAYMAPEQVEARHSEIGPATDVYALGVILYQLVTGQRPFEGSSASIFGQIVSRVPDAPSKLRRELPVEIDVICLKAIAKSPSQRHASAAALADELARFLTKSSDVSPTISFRPAGDSPGGAPSEGDASTANRSRRDAELRNVTVAIFSYEGEDSLSTDSSASHSELLHEQAQSFAAFVTQQVAALGGVTVQSSGQEVIACFGFPQAFEDASQRAIRAALQVQRELSAAGANNAGLPAPEQAWVTIHSGEAVAEEIGGSKSAAISLVGDARNMVTRLNAIAQPGTITISTATHQRVAIYFECESLGTQRVRGVAQPVERFKVLKESASRNRVELTDPGNLTPLVGRDTELTILKDRWEQALEELGQIVLLIGDAGLGKSRLIRELREHVLRQDCDGAAVIELRCSQYHQSTGFFPVVDFFSRLLDFENHSAADRRELVVKYLRELKLESADNVALFSGMLSLPADARFPALALSPQKLKERTEELLLRWLTQLVQVNPVLFIVEDLHWVDPSTLELLEQHVAEFESGRILSLLTFRPEFETPWKSKPHQTQIALNRLTKRQIGEMMRKRTKRRDIPEAIVHQLVERTDGIPLFIEEFTAVIVESGILDKADAGTNESALLYVIPTTLNDLLLARLDRMASEREVVQLAATIGREFGFSLLAASCSLPEDKLVEELDKLVKAEILFKKGQGASAGYIFKHALLQDAAYRSMLTKKRQACHQRIAEVIETRFPDITASQPELLAQHFTEAGVADKAINYWGKAGQKSQQQSANHEAISHYRNGLKVVATLPESPQRDGLELSLTVPLGVSMLAAKGYANPEAGPVFDRARVLAERVGDPPTQFYILWGTWAWRLVRSDLNECRRLYARLLELAAQQSDTSWTCEAHFAPEVVNYYAGDFAASCHHAEQSIPLFEPAKCVQHMQGTGQDVRTGVLSFHGMSLWPLGHVDRGLSRAREVITVSRTFNHPMSLSFAFHHGVWTMLCARLWEEALALAEEGLRLANEQGLALWIASNTAHVGACLVNLGKLDDGLQKLQAAFEGFAATGGRCAIPLYLTMLGEGHCRAGRLDQSADWIEKSFAWAAEHDNQNHVLAETHRIKGEILLARNSGDTSAAEASFQDAIRVAQSQQARSWELRAIMSLARVWQRQGKTTAARELLQPAFGWFTEGLNTPDLVDAQDLLQQLA